jgi:antitoxin (DNA-binding transcriptional repressor) of toxin-antitoxin stability system
MTVMSVREFNANVSRVIRRAELGETIAISRDGEVVASLCPGDRTRDASLEDDVEALRAALESGVRFGRRFSHDERNG